MEENFIALEKYLPSEKYLPIGSVVTIANHPKTIIIVGYGAYEQENNEEQPTIYDYCGYPYPEGYTGEENIVIFNHNVVTEIKHKGYMSDNYSQINEEIKNMIENSQKEI